MAKKKTQTAGEQYHVPNLERALAIMELIANRPEGLNMSETAAALKIPRNSAFRILSTLLAHQYVLRDEATQKFFLSGKLLGLGCRATGTDRLLSICADVLPKIRDETGETALMGRLVDDYGVVLQQAPSKQAVKVQVEIGTRFHLHTAAPAKVILAWSSDAHRDRIISEMTYPKLTSRTITSRKEYLASLEKTRKQGYGTDIGEEVEGITCIAAPIYSLSATPVAAIWITGPSMRMPASKIASFAATIIGHAKNLSLHLGNLPS